MATSLIIGEATKKENVVDSGTPDSTKPRNNGTAEQEQNGVIIPNNAAKMLPVNRCLRERNRRIFSGGKKVRTIEMVKIITTKRINIFKVSKIKKLVLLASSVSILS